MDWSIERFIGSASDFHARDPEPRRSGWVLSPSGATLVLGSTQPRSLVDDAACEREAVAVARRRSGGGAVLLRPGEVTWVDVVIPRRDPLWHDDVGRSMWWVGELWARALGRVGYGTAQVHQGALVTTSWSRVVCFDGLGPGEVVVGGAKAVGISQRRTAAYARFQCAVYHRYDPADLLGLLAPPRPPRQELRPVAVIADSGRLVDVVLDELSQLS